MFNSLGRQDLSVANTVRSPLCTEGPGPICHPAQGIVFFRATGLLNFTYMSDQEGACTTMIQQAIQETKGRGEWVGAVPETSAVGQSQSNGRAERSVQRLEDHVRTLLAELEGKLGCQLKPDSTIVGG